MPVEYEDIKREEGRLHHDRACYTHPAFAQIGVSAVSGGTYLYGSDFKHHNYVLLRIKRSELNRSLSTDWPHAREELIEVALSESQWASLVSSMNRGEGVQCTLQHVGGKAIPQIPKIESRVEQFRTEGSESADEAVAAINKLREEIADSKLSQKQKNEWTQRLDFIKGRTTGNLKFVAGQFGEHMEKVVHKAKTEVAAYIHGKIVRSGLSQIIGQEDAKKVLGFEERE